jgi:hypothetical protein
MHHRENFRCHGRMAAECVQAFVVVMCVRLVWKMFQTQAIELGEVFILFVTFHDWWQMFWENS